METWREELQHHGVKGQKWGVRHYRNKGDPHLKAEAKEVALRTAKSAAPKLAFATKFYLTSSGKMFDIINFAKEFLSTKYDMKVIDSNGREVTEALLKV